MIHLDATKTVRKAGPGSGLRRVSARLREELGAAATAIRWGEWDRRVGRGDWYLAVEPFGEEERPGFTAFLDTRPCRCAAIFHDAIPIRHPAITWPRSVARHPGYMKLLARFDLVWAVSAASREDLLGFWRWQGVEKPPPVEVLSLGADFNRAPRVSGRPAAPGPPPELLCVGILEPRKNQALLLEAAAALWAEGAEFGLRLVGRVNPHFGAPILARVRELRRRWPGLRHDAAMDDAELSRRYAGAWASVFPTLAEGCGLPLLESLWQGTPCLCSDLPVLRENAEGGGCALAAPGDLPAWTGALRRLLADRSWRDRLAEEARKRPLPTWAGTAAALQSRLTA